MLSERIRDLLQTHRLVVAIGARGTGKSQCARELTDVWHGVGVQVLRIDAASAEKPQDLDHRLTAALGCDSTELTARYMPEDGILRVIVDRAEHLYDRAWLGDLQERWRALLADEDSKGRLAIVFFGRPVFRQIAGGDSSPLLNAGPVITPRPLSADEIKRQHGVDASCASVVLRKTGGHPKLAEALVEAIDGDSGNVGKAIGGFIEANRSYLVSLIQDHPLPARAALSELLEKRSPLQQGALIRRHFGAAHADGVEAIDDLTASGLLVRDGDGGCAVGAELLRSVDGLRGLLGPVSLTVPAYDAELMGEAARLLFEAENRLRKLVAESLADAEPGGDDAWWVSRVPPELRGDAEARRDAEGEMLAVEDTRLHPVMYLSLGELLELIRVKENWDRIFRAVFPIGRSGFEESARRLTALRNRVAHSRPLSADAVRELEGVTRRLGLGEVRSPAG